VTVLRRSDLIGLFDTAADLGGTDLDIAPFDLLVSNLYPFEQTVASGASPAQCVEQIDIGGPAMVRAAAKNHATVAVVTSPDMYPDVLTALGDGGFTLAQRSRLAARAYAHTAAYDAAVAGIVRAHGGRLLALAAELAAGPGTEAGAATEANRGAAAADKRLAADLAELARILTLSGITMGVAGSTAPASGMEHAVSHLLEMAANARGQLAGFHGTQVGVASVVAAATWAHVRRRIDAGALGQPARIPDPDQARDRIREAFKGIDSTGLMAAECFTDYARKLRPLVGGSDPLAGLRDSWDRHEAVLAETLIDPGELASGLRSAGLPTSFGELPEPVSDEDARWAVASCPLQRQRFGIADLAMLLGAWEEDDIDEVLAEAAVLTGQP